MFKLPAFFNKSKCCGLQVWDALCDLCKWVDYTGKKVQSGRRYFSIYETLSAPPGETKRQSMPIAFFLFSFTL